MRENLYNQKQNFGKNLNHKGLTSTELDSDTLGGTLHNTLSSRAVPTKPQHQQIESLVVPPVGFAQDFAVMKKLIASFQNKLQSQDQKILELSNQVTKLAQVNLKLNADSKVMRKEHDAMQHVIYKVEKKCS